MKTRKVIVLPYDSTWKSDFEKIKAKIENAVGDLILSVEHVGSTSVEGLSAKPCIDIDVGQPLTHMFAYLHCLCGF